MAGGWRAAARALTPPFLWRAARRLAGGRAQAPWEGVYAHRRDVPESGPGFDGKVWLDEIHAYLDSVLAARATHGRVPREVVDAEVLGALVSAFLGRAKVLDFGGGIGASFVALASCLPPGFDLDYAIVERREVAEAGAARFRDDKRVRFLTELPPAQEAFDVVHVRTALQYVDDYAGLLRRLAGYGARHVLLMATAAGPQPTFASAQVNHRGSRIGYWFHNEDELVGILAANGYRLGHVALLGREDRQDNLPPTHRIGRPRDLVFHRT